MDSIQKRSVWFSPPLTFIITCDSKNIHPNPFFPKIFNFWVMTTIFAREWPRHPKDFAKVKIPRGFDETLILERIWWKSLLPENSGICGVMRLFRIQGAESKILKNGYTILTTTFLQESSHAIDSTPRYNSWYAFPTSITVSFFLTKLLNVEAIENFNANESVWSLTL